MLKFKSYTPKVPNQPYPTIPNKIKDLYDLISKMSTRIDELEKRIESLDSSAISIAPIQTEKNSAIDDFHRLMTINELEENEKREFDILE